MPFQQNRPGRTFKEYEAISKKLEKDDSKVNWDDDKDIYAKVEKKYWDMVEYQTGEPYKIEYAADLDANEFGTGFGTKTQEKIPAS